VTTPLRQSIDDAIRPTLLIGLQDADLSGPGGTERIGEWADWIATTAAAAAQQAAEACPLHSPTGAPCDCGHAGGADCHPNPNGVTR
jgi:hypothetical protein